MQIYTLCPYCGAVAKCVPDPNQMYPERVIWQCAPCDARVGCHPGTCAPLGTLADAQTRDLRVLVHQKFDRIWQEGHERAGVYRSIARRTAYRWLAAHLDITEAVCHVAMFDAEWCNDALAVLDRKTWTHVELWRQDPAVAIPPPPCTDERGHCRCYEDCVFACCRCGADAPHQGCDGCQGRTEPFEPNPGGHP